MPAGPAPHSSAAQSNITRARSMLCGRYAPSHAGHAGTLGACCCRTCCAPNISSKILWKCPAVGRAAAAARRADSASGRPRRDARPRRPPRPGHAPRRRRRRPPPTSTPDGNRSDPEGARRRPLNATVSKVDNLVWLPRTRKNENWSLGPTVDEFCAGTCACQLRFYGDPGLTKVLPGPTVA